jgi:opacity protein-like surface antigen
MIDKNVIIRWRIKFFMIPFILISLTSPSRGEIYKNTLELGIFSGAHVFLNHRDVIKNDFVLGGRIGWNFAHGIGTEFNLSYIPAISDPIDLITFDLNAVYHFYNKGRIIPYVTVGAGFARYFPKGKANNTAFEVTCGIGVIMLYWRTWGLRFDVRYTHMANGPTGSSIRFHALVFGLGFDFVLFSPAVITIRKSEAR